MEGYIEQKHRVSLELANSPQGLMELEAEVKALRRTLNKLYKTELNSLDQLEKEVRIVTRTLSKCHLLRNKDK
jgi:prefoldin subunit 5